MTIYQLQVFLTAAKFRSFSLAADALDVRQPSVSLIIQGLQRELDIRLFERLGNKIQLTPAGEALLREAEVIVTKAAGIKEKIEEIKGLRKGRISVGGCGLAGATFLPVVIQRFKQEHPGIEVNLSIETSGTLERKIMDVEIDLALMSWPPDYSTIYSEPLTDEEVTIIAPPKHRLATKRSVTIEEASSEPWVAYKTGHGRAELEKAFAEKGLRFTPALEVDVRLGMRDVIKSIVMHGFCIGYISQSHVSSDIKLGRLRRLSIQGLNLKRTLHIVLFKTRLNIPHMQAFLKYLKGS